MLFSCLSDNADRELRTPETLERRRSCDATLRCLLCGGGEQRTIFTEFADDLLRLDYYNPSRFSPVTR